MNEVLALNAALALAETLFPIIEQKVKSGEITPEEQQSAREKYLAQRAQADALFQAEHWKPQS